MLTEGVPPALYLRFVQVQVFARDRSLRSSPVAKHGYGEGVLATGVQSTLEERSLSEQG